MINDFIGYVSAGDFEKADEISRALSKDEKFNALMDGAYSSENICIYGFLEFLLRKNPTPELHGMLSNLLSTAYAHLPGAYTMAFYPIKKALNEEPDSITYLESLLLFYEIPEQLLSKEEAEKTADKLLALDPGNKTALKIRKEIRGE